MSINEIKKQATTLNENQLAQIKGGGNERSSTKDCIIIDMDVI